MNLATLEQQVREVAQESEPAGVIAIPLGEIIRALDNDPNELLKNRFLCRGGGMMVNGPTGIGKSSFIMQAAICFSLGRPFFGIQPNGPLSSVIVQAENDDGDLAEMRDGVMLGLSLSDEEKAFVSERVLIVSDNCHTGADLVTCVLRPVLETYGPHLLWMDNLFAYCGCSVVDQEKMSFFLRTLINPLAVQFRCSVVIAHHTNKPQATAEQKAEVATSDAAYLGSGSGELANWPRAVLSIRTLKTDGTFELIAGKRGQRLRWKDANGNRTRRRIIAHSADGLIYWSEGSVEEPEAKKLKPSKYDVQQLMVVGQELAKESLVSKAKDTMGENKAKGFISELIDDGILKVIKKPRSGTNPAIHLERIL